jgi:hypothetical protein
MKQISVTRLKRKYPNPERGIVGCNYCVGGALCREVGIDRDFPDADQLRDAILKANRKIDWYAISDMDREYLWSLIQGVILSNDTGDFDRAWKLLGQLLHAHPEIDQ